MDKVNISRRAFLLGSTAVVATAALPISVTGRISAGDAFHRYCENDAKLAWKMYNHGRNYGIPHSRIVPIIKSQAKLADMDFTWIEQRLAVWYSKEGHNFNV